MIGAGWYLLRRTTRNRARRLLRQLRSPRYAAALALGLLYLALVFLGQGRGRGPVGIPASAVATGGSVLVLLLVAKWWLFSADRSALAFTPAEIQFLFPAPATRAAVLGYRLARNQLPILFNVLVWLLLMLRGTGTGAVLRHAAGLWIFFTMVSLHRLGVALTRDSLLSHGAAGWRRAWPALVAAFAVVGAVAWTIQEQPRGDATLLAWAGDVMAAAPLRWLLLPFRIPLAPLGAATLGGFLASLPAALGLLGLHVWWVLRADREFEDAALEASARRAERLARWRTHGSVVELGPAQRRRRLPLAPAGPVVTAIVWKNLTRLLRTVNPVLVGLLLAIGVGGGALALLKNGGEGEAAAFVATLALTWTALLVVLGPQWVRADLRGETEHLDLLRTWPVPGFQVMAGMVLSSALVLTALQLLLGGMGLALIASRELPGAGPGLLIGYYVAGAVVAAGCNCLMLGLQNAGALLFPAWVRTELRPGGVEQLGQQLLTVGVSMVLMLILLLGPGLLGLAGVILLRDALGNWVFVLAGLVAGAALLLEAFLLVDWMGDRFEAGAREPER